MLSNAFALPFGTKRIGVVELMQTGVVMLVDNCMSPSELYIAASEYLRIEFLREFQLKPKLDRGIGGVNAGRSLQLKKVES